MSIYSIDKLINETRRLAAEFKRSTGTMLPVSGEIARYDVSQHLGFVINDEASSGYDATSNDTKQYRVIIKSRVIGDSVKSSHRIGQLNVNGQWDYVVLSLMNNDFEPMEMYQLSRDKIIENTNANGEKKSKRGALSVAKFKAIGELLWASDSSKVSAKSM